MKTYAVYWIDREIAAHYIHRGEQLYQFFAEHRNAPYHPALYKQYLYITNAFPVDQLTEELEKQRRDKTSSTGKHDIILFGNTHDPVHVSLFDRQIIFKCDMLHDAEKELFPFLRRFEPYLFVTGVDHFDYGWMSLPVHFTLDYAK